MTHQAAYLTRTIIHDGRIISGLNIVRITDGGDASIEPFSVETPATIYHDAPVAVVRADAITDALIDDLEQLAPDPVCILAYLKASSLFATPATGAILLPL